MSNEINPDEKICLSNVNLKSVVKEVVREELKPELEKMKAKNQHLQEGNMYLNE